jgi:hypothetical protein
MMQLLSHGDRISSGVLYRVFSARDTLYPTSSATSGQGNTVRSSLPEQIKFKHCDPISSNLTKSKRSFKCIKWFVVITICDMYCMFSLQLSYAVANQVQLGFNWSLVIVGDRKTNVVDGNSSVIFFSDIKQECAE